MSVYRYRFHRKIYWYFRVKINGKQFCRRLQNGKRFNSEFEASLAESMFLKKNGSSKEVNKQFISYFSDDFISFLKERYKGNTLYSFQRIWKKFYVPRLASYKLQDLDKTIFISLSEQINDLDFVDVHVYVSVGKNFLKYLHKYNIVISEDVFISRKVKKKIINQDIEFWSYEEFSKFITVVDDIYWKFLFSVLYYYGLRIGELRGLRKDCFLRDKLIINSTISNKTIEKGQVVSTTKTFSSNRIFPMLDHIWMLYEEFKKVYYFKSDYIFYSIQSDSLVIGETTIRSNLMKYCKLSEVKYIKPHSFRHSCASLLINNGANIMIVAKYLGHTKIDETLNTYSHLFKSKMEDIINIMNTLY